MNNVTLTKLPTTEKKYIGNISKEIHNILCDQLIGIYLFGSGSYGGYTPGISDLDLQIVTKKSLNISTKVKLVSAISHRNIPCPAKKLEFVSYPIPALNPVHKHPKFDINFNSGRNMKDHICFNYKEEPRHWFLLDIAIGRELGTNLFGPKPDKVFSKIPEEWIAEAMIKCIDWYLSYEPDSPDLVLNACRCWRFAETGIMCSKKDGLEWALSKENHPKILDAASEYKKQGRKLNLQDSLEFINYIKLELSRKY